MSGDYPSFRKDLLHPGSGSIPLFQKNTKAFFHFRSYKAEVEGEPVTSPDLDMIIDDSRKMGNGPFELLIGREFKLDIWEEMVKTMRVREMSRFTCPFQRVIEYPRVSKALREMSLRAAGKEPPAHTHQCSFATMQHGTGYKDLDELIKDAVPVCFELELLQVKQPGDYKPDYWALNDQEREDAIPVLKEEGNALYKKGEYLLASRKYFQALSYLEQQLLKEKPQSDTWNRIALQKVPFLCNYAQCMLSMGDYAEVIRHTTSVLEIDENNVKALFRRGKAHSASWDVEEAKRDLTKAADLDPSLASTVDKELKSLGKRVKDKDADEREMLKGKMFT